jgi:hypothetical protein
MQTADAVHWPPGITVSHAAPDEHSLCPSLPAKQQPPMQSEFTVHSSQ